MAGRGSRRSLFEATAEADPDSKGEEHVGPAPGARWFVQGAGASGFRDFPGSPMMKENRNDSHRTPAPKYLLNPP